MSKHNRKKDPGFAQKLSEFRSLIQDMGMEKETAMLQMAETTRHRLQNAERNMAWLTSFLPSANDLPPNWRVFRLNMDAGTAEYGRMDENENCNLAVIASCTLLDDGFAWMHLGISHPFRYPDRDEEHTVRQLFTADQMYSYVTVPSGSEIIASRELPVKIINMFVNLGSAALEAPVPTAPKGSSDSGFLM